MAPDRPKHEAGGLGDGGTMNVRALIGPMSSAVGRQGIARLLATAPRGYRSAIDAEQCDAWEDVLARIAAEPFDVLIAEFGAGSPPIDRFFQLQPKLSVIEVDLAGGATNVHVFDVGSETLVRLAEWLSREAGLTGANDSIAHITHADPARAAVASESSPPTTPQPAAKPVPSPPTLLERAAAPPPPRASARVVPMRPDSYRDSGEQIADLTAWLALKLNLALARAEAATAGHDLSHWTMTATRARALLDPRLADLPLPDLAVEFKETDRRLATRGTSAAGLPLTRLAAAFELDDVERQMLYLALASELDGRFAQAFGFLADDLTQRRPNASTLAELIEAIGPPWQVRRRLVGLRPFARFAMVGTAPGDLSGIPDTQVPLAAPADIVAFLLGEPAAAGQWTLFDPAEQGAVAFDLQAAPVVAALRAAGEAEGPKPVVRLAGGEGEELWLAEQLAAVGIAALVGGVAAATDATGGDGKDKLRMLARQARLADAVLIVTGFDAAPAAQRPEICAWLAETFAGELKLLVLQGRHIDPVWLRAAAGGVLEIGRDVTSREERATIWARAAAARGISLSADASRALASTFAFTRAQAEAALALAVGTGGAEGPEGAGEALRDAARLVSKASAPASVRRVETGLGWDDIVLPAAVAADLRSIPAQIRHAETVWEQWGFGERIPYGQGIAALFAGPSGTGKTMAAQIIARELGTALFQVDLAKTVSKYIGETEKALDAIFDAAEAAGAVLLFDEADALFGKRSEIKDAHDRYANLEVAYLLQRIEAYRGLAILTTNLKENLDAAFLRRLRFIVDFPMPDADSRLAIWTRMFPEEAPLGTDVDLSLLARQLPLSGGNIEQSVVNAAFKAAEDDGVIRMSHLVAATRAELAKIGMESAGRSLTRLVGEADTAGAEP